MTQLVTKGPFEVVRHPTYAATIVATMSMAVVGNNILVLACSLGLGYILYLLTFDEEVALTKQHGTSYVRYKKRTPRLAPVITI